MTGVSFSGWPKDNNDKGSSTPDPSLREDLVESAVEFLRDPRVKGTTLQKKVGFLESKGMNTEEIQAALTRSLQKKRDQEVPKKSNSSAAGFVVSKETNNTFAPPRPASFTWKEYLLTSAVFGVVTYSTFQLAQKFLVPLLNWPSEENLEKERQRMDKHFDQAFLAIETVKKDTQTIFSQVKEHHKSLDASLTEVSKAIETIRDQDNNRSADVDNLWEEMEGIKSMIPEIFSRNQNSQENLLSELQSELRSLKAMLNRKLNSAASSFPNTPVSDATPYFAPYKSEALTRSQTLSYSSSPTSQSEAVNPNPANPINPERKIPAWQLAFRSNTNGPVSSTSSNSPTSNSNPSSPINAIIDASKSIFSGSKRSSLTLDNKADSIPTITYQKDSATNSPRPELSQ